MPTLLPPSSSGGDDDDEQLPLNAVPSLSWIALSILHHHPEQVHHVPCRLNYRPELNVIQDVLNMDPRMWATLVQLYDDLPQYMKAFAVSLRDPHMLLLQSIPCTPRFSLITVLEAPACRSLCDENIAELKGLSTLTALDASDTRLTSHGVKALASTLHDTAGPWALRILDLRACMGITADVYAHLSKFPLLSVVDLRGTKCSRSVPPPPGFSAKGNPLLFHPAKPPEALARLHEANPNLHSSPNVYTLLANTRELPKKPASVGLVSSDNSVVTIADGSLYLDNGNAIARRIEAREERLRHEENSAAWHWRRELLELQEAEYEELYPFSAVRRKVLMNGIQPNAVAGPSRLSPPTRDPRPVSMNLPSGFQPKPLGRSATTQSSRGVKANALTRGNSVGRRDHLTPRTVPLAPDRPTQRGERRPPAISSRSRPDTSSLPSGFQPLPPITRPTKRHSSSSTSRLGVQAPARPDPQAAAARIWLNPDEEPFMLYRDPPPWSALQEAQGVLRSEQAKRRGQVERNVAMRASGIAHVDLTSEKAAAAKQQIGSLLAKRTEMRRSFGLIDATPTSGAKTVTCTPLPSTNPFKKRAVAPPNQPLAGNSVSTLQAIQATPGGKARKLIPISKVPTPIFTQDMLDASSKENRKAGVGHDEGNSTKPTAKNRKCSPHAPDASRKSKHRPRMSEPAPGASSLRNWLITK